MEKGEQDYNLAWMGLKDKETGGVSFQVKFFFPLSLPPFCEPIVDYKLKKRNKKGLRKDKGKTTKG